MSRDREPRGTIPAARGEIVGARVGEAGPVLGEAMADPEPACVPRAAQLPYRAIGRAPSPGRSRPRFAFGSETHRSSKKVVGPAWPA
jgi:hypothetical protein